VTTDIRCSKCKKELELTLWMRTDWLGGTQHGATISCRCNEWHSCGMKPQNQLQRVSEFYVKAVAS
jgi:hypothetical protein